MSWRGTLLIVTCCGWAGGPLAAQDLDGLDVLGAAYPRAFFFRETDLVTARGPITYDRWEANFSRLMGIEGKVLDEEIPGCRARNLEFFTRFKRGHPRQLVLLHYNGTARDPRDRIEAFHPGHWLYYNGSTIGDDLPAAGGEAELHVARPELFRTGIGRFRTANEDLGLCALDDAGRPDWSRSEQVELLGVDPARGTIRVRRGCYGSRPRAFQAGRAYAAAHVSEGPWGRDLHLLWMYNFATCCPRDAAGQTCADVLAAELAAHFAPGGDLETLDGVEFDELNGDLPPLYRQPDRGPDEGATGRADPPPAAGPDRYGLGIVEFCHRLRQRLGPQRLILADGFEASSQRAFGILNGIESEGFPANIDWEIRDWSGGLNRLSYWQHNAAPPVFTYIAHKFVVPGSVPGQMKPPDVPPAEHRLVLAAAMFTDSAVCYVLAPPKSPDGLYGIWDELRKGAEHQLGWLGRPLGPALHLAVREKNVLAARSPAALLDRLKGPGLSFSVDGDAVKIAATDPHLTQMQFRLAHVPWVEPDLLVAVTMHGDPLPGCAPEIARLAWVGLPGVDARSPAARSGRHMTWIGRTPFESAFYFPVTAASATELQWTIEGPAPVWLSGLGMYHAPDAMYREFEHGLVLANPAPRPYPFDLERLLPGRAFRRLRGSPEQDPATNDGTPLRGPVVLAPKDGLFLVRR